MTFPDPVIEAYKAGVDRSLLRENLKLTPQQRSERFTRAMRLVFELQRSAAARKQASSAVVGENSVRQASSVDRARHPSS